MIVDDLGDCVLGVVGGAGEMGKWFMRELRNDFKETLLFDKDLEKCKEISSGLGDVVVCDGLGDLERCDVVIVAVPIDVFEDVITDLVPFLSDCLLLDICSVKMEPVESMKEAFGDSDVVCVGTHPLFGPTEPGLVDKNFVLVPVDDGAIRGLREFLLEKGACVVEMGAREHDEAMAVVQGLTHLVVTSFGKVFCKKGKDLVEDLNNLMTPTFSLLYKDMLRIYKQDPGLFASILNHNNFVEEAGESFLTSFEEALGYVGDGDRDGLVEFIREGRSCLGLDLDRD